jgi:aryl-phospho-beta-D-glucosidase BglC (GH1 family)
MWKFVVNYFKNENNIIGYELFNEPFGISPYDHPY